eukprot:9506754-Ditylum_brightwellii.AAC.1
MAMNLFSPVPSAALCPQHCNSSRPYHSLLPPPKRNTPMNNVDSTATAPQHTAINQHYKDESTYLSDCTAEHIFRKQHLNYMSAERKMPPKRRGCYYIDLMHFEQSAFVSFKNISALL